MVVRLFLGTQQLANVDMRQENDETTRVSSYVCKNGSRAAPVLRNLYSWTFTTADQLKLGIARRL